LPKIIRSSGVNIDRARPLVMPFKEPEVEEEIFVAVEEEVVPEEEKPVEAQPQMDQIYASAELIVEEIITKARNDADNMLVDARQETIKVLQDAMREGWDQGVNEALKEMHAMQDAAIQEVDAAIESLIAQRRQMIRDVEHDVVELVFDIVDKVLTVEMDRSTDWIAALVRTALAEMEGDDNVIMKVSAGARQRVVETAANMLAAAGKQPSRLTIVAGTSVKPGACVIETGKGSINTSVENKFDKLKTELRENT
jgi:flagellar assembly protein FliH